jgi:CRISPR system Cascade subunit CasD
MPEHLVFTLTAAIGAMGGLAGHERRGSWTWPGRSAILGLLAAALGIRRDGDFSALAALRIAVAIFDEGQPLRDYHTVETIPTAKLRAPQSRPQALRDASETNTTITLRDYRCDPLFGVAVTGGDLPALAGALASPVFGLYLGRKSCPLSAPVRPLIVAADTVEQALAHLHLPPWRRGRVATLLACDGPAHPGDRVELRHDEPLDRRAWHFAARPVTLRSVAITAEAIR